MELVKNSLQTLHLVLELITKSYLFRANPFCNKKFAFNLRNNFIFICALDNWCENARDLTEGNLIVDNNMPLGTYCQWLISAEDDEHYVNLEFENLDVRITELNYLPCLILLSFYLDQILV